LLTGTVVMVNVPVFCPAGIVMLAGTVAAALAVDSAMTAPAVGAFPFKVTVAVEDTPPRTVVGLMLSDKRTAGVTVRFALRLAPEYVAKIAIVALVAPAATVIFAGTVVTLVSALDRATIAPPAGAALASVTVPVEVAPLTTEVGLRLRAEMAAPAVLTDRMAVFTPLYEAEMVTGVEVETESVVIVNVPVVAPAAMVTVAGTFAADVLSDESATTAPVVGGAGELSVIVAVEDAPEMTEVGFSVRFETETAPAGVTVSVAVCWP
jgi:hypothetical protein